MGGTPPIPPLPTPPHSGNGSRRISSTKKDPILSINKALTTTEVHHLCTRAIRGCSSVSFLGVFAAHSIPGVSELGSAKLRDKRVFFVCNTHTRDKGGEHWVVFYFSPNERPFLFDSFGRSPRQMGHSDWSDYMTAVSKVRNGGNGEWNRQRRPVQCKNTSVCGVLCAFYIWYKCRGLNPPLNKIVSKSRLINFLRHLK